MARSANDSVVGERCSNMVAEIGGRELNEIQKKVLSPSMSDGGSISPGKPRFTLISRVHQVERSRTCIYSGSRRRFYDYSVQVTTFIMS